MGYKRREIAESEAEERSETERTRFVYDNIVALGLNQFEEKLVGAIWIFVYEAVNEIGVAELLQTYFQHIIDSDPPIPHDPSQIKIKLAGCELFKQELAPKPFIRLHLAELLKDWHYWIPAVENLVDEAASTRWHQSGIPQRCRSDDPHIDGHPYYRIAKVDPDVMVEFMDVLAMHTYSQECAAISNPAEAAHIKSEMSRVGVARLDDCREELLEYLRQQGTAPG